MSAMTEASAAASQRRMMVLSAAVMFGGGTLVQLIESLVPGGQSFSLLPGLSAGVAVILLVLFGPRLPRPALAALGPIGVAMIASSLASTNVQGDGAVLYMWPVLWEAYFFGWRGTVLIIACVAAAHGGALLVMAHGAGNLDRWIDVMSAVSIVGAVVELLSTRNQQLVARISEEARADELTRLLNRRGFDEGAARELVRATREGSSIGVAAFDLDHFKRVNDEFGHEAGDQVLVRFADCLRSQARAVDLVARMGGEEFLALLPGADLEQTGAFTERVRAMLRVPSVDPGIPSVTVSAGATAALAPENIDALLKRADMALYAAKYRGRDRTVVERPGADADSVVGLQVGEHGEDSPMVT